ncbi:hypothetical protein [Cylindrospermum stagnale]|uniref:hypothetical protein n=1 Tax=Cylindrospermum stagnale TaxID=142864 RepID=UPI0012F65926|nr:hypothetical protein [Cylindrospermum stagnale]
MSERRGRSCPDSTYVAEACCIQQASTMPARAMARKRSLLFVDLGSVLATFLVKKYNQR